tara:strand:+ start:489 stop:623 length:135 start_codon:yes stop_codon:yes gene_type:complete
MIHLKIIVDSGGTFQDIEIVSKPTHIDLKIEEEVREDDNWYEEE